MMIVSIVLTCSVWVIFMIYDIYWKRPGWYLYPIMAVIPVAVCVLLAKINVYYSLTASLLMIGYFIVKFVKFWIEEAGSMKERERILFQEYKADIANGKTICKDYILPSGRKLDCIDFEEKKIYMLKPYATHIGENRKKEMEVYLKELEDEFGGEWRYTIDTY